MAHKYFAYPPDAVGSESERIRLIASRAFGFHSAEALIGRAMLALGAFEPCLPGRQAAAID